LGVFVEQGPVQLRSRVEGRLLESDESVGQVNQVELRGSAQYAEGANERQFATGGFLTRFGLVEEDLIRFYLFRQSDGFPLSRIEIGTIAFRPVRRT
jgi:hypothetical protein